MKTGIMEQEKEDRNIKVFLNPLIMTNIAKHLPTNSLLCLRSTCKIWNKAITPECRKRFPTNYIKVFGQEDLLDAIVVYLSSCHEIPFGKYHFARQFSFTSPRTRELIAICGPIMTYLQLTLDESINVNSVTFQNLILKQTPVLQELQIIDAKQFNEEVELWTLSNTNEEGIAKSPLSLPYLKRILLTLCGNGREGSTLDSYSFVYHLCNVALNLEYIHLNGSQLYQNLLHAILLQGLKVKKRNLGKLQEFAVVGQLRHGDLLTLVELSQRPFDSTNNRLQLKKFNLDNVDPACFEINDGLFVLNELLALQASSLKFLITDACSKEDVVKHYLSILRLLKSLCRTPEYFYDPAEGETHTMPNIVPYKPIKNNFYQLQELEVNLCVIEPNATYANQPSTCNFMEYFDAREQLDAVIPNVLAQYDFNPFNESNYITGLAGLFPNITTLKVCLVNHICSDIWTTWPNLVVLDILTRFHLKEGLEIDSWITGIPQESLPKLKDSESTVAGIGWKELKTQPGLIDLQFLREFTLKFETVSHEAGFFVQSMLHAAFITDYSGYYAFVNCSRLRKITIQNCSDFSMDCVAAIKASVGSDGDFVAIRKGVCP